MRQSRHASSSLAITNPSATDLHSHSTHHIATGNTYASGGQGYGVGSTKGRNSLQSGTSHGIPGSMEVASSPKMSSLNGNTGMGMQSQQSLNREQAGAQPQTPTSQSTQTIQHQTPVGVQSIKKAKALYGYTASPDDANEIGFVKGEILDILDSTGKWFSARKQDGTRGIVPR